MSKRSTKSRPVMLAAILLLACFTTACQPTPEASAIVNKNDGRLEETLHQSLASPGRYEAPAHWSETVENEKLTIFIDADIAVPDVDKYPVVKLEPATFTQQRVDELVDYFAAGKKLYLPYAKTKADYEKEIIEARRGQEVDGQYVVTDDSLKWVKELEKKQAAAPDDSPKIYTDTTLTYNKDYETMADVIVSGKNFLSVMVENGGGDDASISLNNYTAGYRSYTSFHYSTNIGYITESAYRITTEHDTEDELGLAGTGELFGKVEMAQADAEEKAQKLIDDLEIKDLVLVKAQKAVSLDAPDKGGYELRYMRQSGGIPVYMFEGGGWHEGEAPPAYSPPFSEEFIIALVTEDGVQGISWRGYANVVETVNENVELLPFEEIQQALKKQIFYKKSFGLDSYGMKDYKIIVTSAEMRMGYIGVKDNVNQALMVPIWVFETDMSFYNTYLEKEQRYKDDAFVLSAIDGGVIEISRIDTDPC